MIDYRLTDGDIVVQSGDLATVSGQEATRQRLEQKLRLWLGEWFLDNTAGFPWLQQILGRTPRPEVVSSLLRQVIESDPGIRNVVTLDLDYAGAEGRVLRADFTAVLTNGETETFEVAI